MDACASRAVKVGERLAGRYRVCRLIAQGGMATVYEVLDESSGMNVALKHLLPRAAEHANAVPLFQREYATLCQLHHPLIIRAYEYGTEDERPYYTMELVSGESLRELAPMDWREAASLLRDVASALALVHSRRLVHRDVTARNVCRTTDGRAKVLDFGSLSPMGVAREITGTPPFVPPESLDGRPLDGRSDLFSLGALGYLLLTGKHAYPAPLLSALRMAWTEPVEPPSAIACGLPLALEQLVLSLLSLDALARPSSAAEVFDRLTAIADLPTGETPEVAKAYLSTPTLVGREPALRRFRRRLLRAERARGSTLLIEGRSGLGRSRLLTTFLSEARLRGMFAVNASGAGGRGQPFAVVRALIEQLVECEAGRTADAAPTLSEALEGKPDDWPFATRIISEWLVAIAKRAGLVLGVDDLDQADEQSVAVLAKVAEAAPSCSLLVLATTETSSAGRSVARFRQIGSSLVLGPLHLSETTALMSAVFGDAPGVDGVARWVHELAEGNPRSTLELAEHLVTSGVACYDQGSWVLPVSLDELNLPRSLDQALDRQVQSIPSAAKRLALALSLTADEEPLASSEYPVLLDEADQGEVFVAVDQLVADRILLQAGSAYLFTHRGMKDAVRRSIAEADRAGLHRRLARAYAAGSARVMVAYHLHQAGDDAHAFETLVGVISSRNDTIAGSGSSFLRSPEGTSFYDRMFEWGCAREATPAKLAIVGRTALSLASVTDSDLRRHAGAILDRLKKDTGLVHWEGLGHISDPSERIRLCVVRAFQEREALPESQRGLEPVRAIKELTICTATMAAVLARAGDAPGTAPLDELIDRLRPLSPAVDVVADVVAYTSRTLRGLSSRELRLRVIERTKEPVPGVDELTRLIIHLLTLYYQALEEAVMGNPSAFDRVAPLEQHAPYAPLAWQVRMIAHLFQGADREAARCRRERDLALSGRFDVDQQLETSVAYEAGAYATLGDLMALKRLLPTLHAKAQKWPGWRPQYLAAKASYQRMRGDLEGARALLEEALALVEQGVHVMWMQVTSRLTHVLIDLDRSGEARALAAAALTRCEGLAVFPVHLDALEMALAVAESHTGDAPFAARRARSVVDRAERGGISGIVLVDLYAAEAKVARRANDDAAFDHASLRIKSLCARAQSAAFATKLSSTLKLSIGGGFEPVTSVTGLDRMEARIRTELELCRGAAERASRALGMLLDYSSSAQGFLYVSSPEGLTLVASRSHEPPPVDTEERLLAWLQGLDGDGNTADTGSGSSFDFVIVGLPADCGGEHAIVATAVIDCRQETPKRLPDSVLSALGQSLFDAGDAVRL